MTTAEFAAALRERDRFLILSHKRPDGDTLGSGAALCSALRRAGKTAFCLPNPQTSETYAAFVAPYDAPAGYAPAVVVAVDVADAQLFPEGFSGKVDLCVDHHSSNTGYAPLTCLNGAKASCGEIVLTLVKDLCGSVTRDEADLLYIAVSTDTGCFQYGNTRGDTFSAAAELLALGANNGALNIRLFRTQSRARMALEGAILTSLRYFRDGQISVAFIPLELLRACGATEDDCDDLAGIPGKAAGSVVGMTIRELAPGRSKVSLRSKPQVNCSAICAEYGGGGHAMASGCELDFPPEETLRRMLAAIDAHWPE